MELRTPDVPRLEQVVLVDEQDRPLGLEEKMMAHETGRLHRAFSAVVFDSRGRMLLQRRALTKYHSGGLWSNTCCSHPRPYERVVDAARRRTLEEMGMACSFEKAFEFVYYAELDGGMVEHEYDHVMVARSNDAPVPNSDEVCEYRWITPADLAREVEATPERFTVWFRELIGPLDAWMRRGATSLPIGQRVGVAGG